MPKRDRLPPEALADLRSKLGAQFAAAGVPYGTCCCGCGETTKTFTSNDTKRVWVKGEPKPYLKAHQLRKPENRYTVDPSTGCWVWNGPTYNGYGVIRRDHKQRRTHVYFYEKHRGPVPEGLDLDHLCRNRACVNPDHLEPVTKGENTMRGEGPAATNARKTHCKRGHELSGDNVYIVRASSRTNPRRVCKTCQKLRRAGPLI